MYLSRSELTLTLDSDFPNGIVRGRLGVVLLRAGNELNLGGVGQFVPRPAGDDFERLAKPHDLNWRTHHHRDGKHDRRRGSHDGGGGEHEKYVSRSSRVGPDDRGQATDARTQQADPHDNRRPLPRPQIANRLWESDVLAPRQVAHTSISSAATLSALFMISR